MWGVVSEWRTDLTFKQKYQSAGTPVRIYGIEALADSHFSISFLAL
jgi:hypothetical protein